MLASMVMDTKKAIYVMMPHYINSSPCTDTGMTTTQDCPDLSRTRCTPAPFFRQSKPSPESLEVCLLIIFRLPYDRSSIYDTSCRSLLTAVLKK